MKEKQKIKELELRCETVEFFVKHGNSIVEYAGEFQQRGIQYVFDGKLKTYWLPYKFFCIKTIKNEDNIALLEITVWGCTETKHIFVLDKYQNVMIDISRVYTNIKGCGDNDNERKETAGRRDCKGF